MLHNALVFLNKPVITSIPAWKYLLLFLPMTYIRDKKTQNNRITIHLNHIAGSDYASQNLLTFSVG